MPITLPATLPAFDVLRNEGVMVMSPERAARQDIRPLRIGLLNLMPKKIQTENQFARLIGARRPHDSAAPSDDPLMQMLRPLREHAAAHGHLYPRRTGEGQRQAM